MMDVLLLGLEVGSEKNDVDADNFDGTVVVGQVELDVIGQFG